MIDVLLKQSVCGDMTIPARKAFGKAARIYQRFRETKIVITSIRDGLHSPGSLHYEGNAFDLRLPSKSRITKIVAALRRELGSPYDVVLERTHIHIEFDP